MKLETEYDLENEYDVWVTQCTACNHRSARATASSPARFPGLVSEHQWQCMVMEWAELQSPKMPELKLLFAVPNGGHRHKPVAMKLKKEGVKRGVPDLCLPVARHGYHGLFIEMKSAKGRLSVHQQKWADSLHQQDYLVYVCNDAESAIKRIKRYLIDEGPCEFTF